MYSFSTFSDIPVIPFSNLPPDLSSIMGGPVWPDWESRKYERHCRDHNPVDERPNLPKKIKGIQLHNAFWGGPIVSHFGHQIADFSMRILPSRFIQPDAKLVFMSDLNKVPLWFYEILHWTEVGIQDVFFTNEAFQFKELSVSEQSEQLWMTEPSCHHLDKMDMFIANKKLEIDPITRPIYISRGGLNLTQSAFAGERYLEHCITLSGGYVFRPESQPLEDQLKVYLGAKELIFAEGSAIHLCQLLGRFSANIDILNRNETVSIIHPIISSRVKSYNKIFTVKNVISGLTSSGEDNIWNTMSIFDLNLLCAYFKSKDLEIEKHWDMDTYIEQATNDILSWVKFNTGNRELRSIESDLKVIDCLQKAGLNSIARYVKNHI